MVRFTVEAHELSIQSSTVACPSIVIVVHSSQESVLVYPDPSTLDSDLYGD